MIISVNWLKKFTDIDLPIDELADLIGSRLVEIEKTVDLGEKYKDVIVAKVVKCEKLPDSDHLSICRIDDGGKVGEVERDSDGLVQVVCGASNVREGLSVAWLPPKSIVPETFGDKVPFVLDVRNLRGTLSNGMLASAKELDLGDDHDGILELPSDASAGSPFAPIYEMDDYLLDIENKSLTHRPDTFGIIGFAREVAAIQGKQFVSPPRFTHDGVEWIEKSGNEPVPKVTIDDPDLSSRYQAVVLTNVDSKVKSSLDTQSYLARIGVKTHSAVVDATNYLMMLTGQPLHAFDYDKLKAVNNGDIDIHVRAGRNEEKLVLIDGREIKLTTGDIVIANGETAVALAGAMGGRDTEIDDNTKNVLLESASFNLYNLRNTQFRHGIFSEAITRFTKGVPSGLTEPVLAEAVVLLAASAGAKRASDVADEYPGKVEPQTLRVPQSQINNVLGSDFGMSQITNTLANAEFSVDVEAPYIVVATPPYWRTDIHIAEDIIEEIGRLNGFDNIAPTLPKRDFTAVSPDNFDRVRAKIRHALTRAGSNEVLTYSFVHNDLFRKAGQDPDNAYRIVNSISPDLQYYRQSLIPSLLSLVHPNIKAGFDEFALFELNKAHVKSDGLDESGLPIERDFLAFVVARKKSRGGGAYYEAKRHLEFMSQQLGLQMTYEPAFDNPKSANVKPFEVRRSAAVKVGDTLLGIVGEFKNSVIKNFKLPEHAAGFVVSSSELARLVGQSESTYLPLSRYPSTERDICFQVPGVTGYDEVKKTAMESLTKSGLLTTIEPLDIYQQENSETKNITFRIRLTSREKTLTGDEVASVVNAVTDLVCTKLDARVI